MLLVNLCFVNPEMFPLLYFNFAKKFWIRFETQMGQKIERLAIYIFLITL